MPECFFGEENARHITMCLKSGLIHRSYSSGPFINQDQIHSQTFAVNNLGNKKMVLFTYLYCSYNSLMMYKKLFEDLLRICRRPDNSSGSVPPPLFTLPILTIDGLPLYVLLTCLLSIEMIRNHKLAGKYNDNQKNCSVHR
jgi:hypothetical protein